MTEREWLECKDPWPMLDFIARRATNRKLRLFACACVRHTPLGDGRKVWDLLTDGPGKNAVNMAERYADDLASKEEMNAARREAHQLADQLRDVAVYAAASPGRTDVAFAKFSIRNSIMSVVNRKTPEKRYENADVAATTVCDFFREVFGPLPFRSVPFCFAWASTAATIIANSIYYHGAFDRLPLLADALEDAGCDTGEILTHCRQSGEHVRGCWVVDLVLGKELQPHDLQLILVRLADNRRLMRVVHIPTGASVEGYRTEDERVWSLKERLMKEIVRKVVQG